MSVSAGRHLVDRWRAGRGTVRDDWAPYPLSAAQQGIWLFEQLHPRNAVYNLCFAAYHDGDLDRARFDAAVSTLIRRHPALRTTFYSGADGPFARTHTELPVHPQWTDVRHLPHGQRYAEAVRLAERAVAAPFDLSRGPLVRVSGYLLGEQEHLLVFSAHHIVCDGASLRVVLRELEALYQAGELPSAAPEPVASPVGDSLVDDSALAYWRSQLAGLPGLDLPTDHARPAQPTFRAATAPVHLAEDLVVAAERLGREENASLFMVILSAFQLLLGRQSGQVDFAVGTPDAGRARPGRHAVVGLLANPLALRADLSGGPTFRELVGRVRTTCMAAFARRDVPFEEVAAALASDRDFDRAPLFQTYLAFHGERGEPRLAGTLLRPLITRRPATGHDVELHLWRDRDGLRGTWDYNAEVFDATTAGSMAQRLTVLLASALAEPDLAADRLDVLSARERALLSSWSEGPAPALPAGCLHELVTRQVERTPESVAVSDGRVRLTYRQLDARTNQLAHYLHDRGIGPEDVVGIKMGRSADLAVAMLGILKAGAAYLPLDPAYPAERLDFMCRNSAVRTVLTNIDDGIVAQYPVSAPPQVQVGADSLAYVLYTSGSTGRPKGVMLTHRNAVALTHWGTTEYPDAHLSRVLASTSICFDLSVFEFFVPLRAGGTVVVVDDALALLGADAPDVTLVNTVPSAARELVAAGALPPSVRVVNLCGEPLTADLVEGLYKAGRVEAVYNLYGPCEDTTYSTGTMVGAHERPPSIGLPLPHKRAYVLDPRLRPVPIGAVGELYLGGHGLARGYHNQPGMTAVRFVADPFRSTMGQRMYRTGDLVRYRADGALIFVGRRDLQVKVRGRRIELGEIESALQRHPGVRDAAVAVYAEQLVAYVTSSHPGAVDDDELRAFLRLRLPDVMVPSTIVTLDALPRTPNGKVDRRALPPPTHQKHRPGAESPRGPAEELVAEAWRAVLDLDAVHRDDHFFELGGHSLLASRVANRLRQRAGVVVPLRLLFERPVLAELAAALPEPGPVTTAAITDAGSIPELGVSQDAASSRLPVVPTRAGPGGSRVAKASPGQRRLWLLSQLDPAANRAYIIQGGMHIAGPLRADLLREAIRTVVARHDALRTTLREVDGWLEQVISPAPDVTLERANLTDDSELPELAKAICVGIDLSRGPLARMHLVRLGEQRHILILTVHHIIADGWSLAILSEEVGLAYTALLDGHAPDLPTLAIQYPDYTGWQSRSLELGPRTAQNAQRSAYPDGLPPLNLRTDRARPPRPSYVGSIVHRRLPADVARKLRVLGARQAATPYMVLLAVFLVLLRRHSGQRDIAVGSPVAGRSRSELERLIGFLVTTAVVRAEVRDDEPFTDLLGRVRLAALDALTEQDVPLDAVPTHQGPAQGSSVGLAIEVMFNYLNQPALHFHVPGLSVEEAQLPRGTAKFDLELYVEDLTDGSSDLALCYSHDLFEPDTARAMLERYLYLLCQLAEDPTRLVGEMPMVPDAGTPPVGAVRAPSLPDTTIGRRFAAQVAQHPDRAAIWTQGHAITYRDLDHRARSLAGLLIGLASGTHDRVAVLCDQGVDAVVALLGVLASERAYLPLDAVAPRERLSDTVRLIGVDAIIADRSNLRLAEEIADGHPVLDVDTARLGTPIPHWPVGDPDAPAYTLLTSGSTGEPKAVVQSHRNAVEQAGVYISQLGITAADRLTMLSAYTSDAGVLDVYGALLTGAVVCPLDLRRDGVAAVRETMGCFGATVYHSTPTAFRLLTAASDTRRWPETVRVAVFGGEELTSADVDGARRQLPEHCRMINLYGASECSIALIHVVEPGCAQAREAVPIGRPVEAITVELLDDDGRPAEVFGEIACSGPALALGYLDEAQTRAAFGHGAAGRRYRTGDLAWRLPDGSLEFAGRRDGRVNMRGHRVETGEIESRLRACPGVIDAVVVPLTDPEGTAQLVAYVGGMVDPARLRSRLYSVLPHYMVPRVVIAMPRLPMSRSGKVGRAGLPEPDWSALVGSAPPRTGTEQVIADAIGVVLEVPAVGRHDNFFDLGGQSLQATRVVGRLREVLGVDVTLRLLFEHPTVAGLADALSTEAAPIVRSAPISRRARVPYGRKTS
jgi:amino acid adenylation domain-containing protein